MSEKMGKDPTPKDETQGNALQSFRSELVDFKGLIDELKGNMSLIEEAITGLRKDLRGTKDLGKQLAIKNHEELMGLATASYKRKGTMVPFVESLGFLNKKEKADFLDDAMMRVKGRPPKENPFRGFIKLGVLALLSIVGAALIFAPMAMGVVKISNYPNGFPNGVAILGMPILNSYTGDVFYVDSRSGSDGNRGTYLQPFATIDKCINSTKSTDTTVNATGGGDICAVFPGHAESGTDADLFDVDVQGVAIVGIGNGIDMPEITFADTDTTVACGAANVTIMNIRFLAGISAIVDGISIEGACDNFSFIGNEFPEPTTSTWEFITAINVGDGADGVKIIGNTHFSMDAAGDGGSHFIEAGDGVNNDLQIIGNYINGEFLVAAIWSDTTDLEVLIENNIITNATNGQHAIEFTTASSALGIIKDNLVRTDAQGSAIDPGSMTMANNCWDDDTTADTVCIPVVLASAGAGSIGGINDTTTDSLHGKIGTDTEMADSSLYDLNVADQIDLDAILADTITLSGGTLPVSPTAGSMAEFISSGTGSSTVGTALGTDKSIIDAIGTDGVTVLDTAVGLAGMIGVDDANNVMATTAILPNADGSVFERAEYLAQLSEQVLAGLRANGRSTGSVFYVDNATGSDADNGTTWALAEATLAAGIGDTTADKGDIVFVAPDHEEALGAAQIAASVAGITIIGLGSGEQQPQVVFDDGTSSIDVTGTDVTIDNINFHSTTANVTITIDVDASGFVLRNSKFTDTGGFEHTISIDIATTLSDIVVEDNTYYGTTAGATSFVAMAAGADTNVIIRNNQIWGDFTLAAIWSDQILVNVLVEGNTIRNIATGVHAVEFDTTASGYIYDNILAGDVAGSILDPGSALAYDNRIVLTGKLDANDLGMMEEKWYHAFDSFTPDGTS
ncbi:hypothetical protein LCGC14_1320780, partial [marine sediment metagenome]